MIFVPCHLDVNCIEEEVSIHTLSDHIRFQEHKSCFVKLLLPSRERGHKCARQPAAQCLTLTSSR